MCQVYNITENISTSSNGGCHSSKELVNVQIQSDDVDTTTTYSEESEKVELNEIISYRDPTVSPDQDIDRALATHIKRSIDKMHRISAVLQGIISKEHLMYNFFKKITFILSRYSFRKDF